MNLSPLDSYANWLCGGSTVRWKGRVTNVVGNLVESAGPFCSVGESCEIIDSSGISFPGEIVGFRGSNVLSMCLEEPQGIRFGDQIVTWGARPSLRVGPEMLGRVIDATGAPLDSLGEYRATKSKLVDGLAPRALDRTPISEPLGCGIRAVDGFLTCGRGQRVGIFGGSGVGKSTLIGMMARGTAADMTVLALVGERGREVADFLATLGPEGRKRSVVVVSTSDQSPLLRIRAALSATAGGRVFLRPGEKRSARRGFSDSIRHGAKRNWSGRRRTAHGQGIHSVCSFHAGEAGRESRPLFSREHHCFLHGLDGRRRSAGSDCGYGSLFARWPHYSRPQAGPA
jgi:flagellum-specific ATP synthase